MAATAIVLPPTTPPDYHRIVSPTLAVPSDPNVSIPVGLLACQRDPLLKETTTTVVSARLVQAAPQPKRAKKNKAAASTEPLVEVVLHDTVIFPEGGGQPSDIGVLTSSDGQLWDVREAKRTGGHAVHYVKVGERGADAALSAFAVGSTVGVALGEAGYYRRLDHMCMHTSQHLLSAVLENTHKLDTLSWSLTEYPTPSYVEIPRALSPEEIAAVQAECNRYVFEGRKVHIEVEELDTEFHQGYKPASVGIPLDYAGGVKRVVIIDGLDRNPCCGTHAPTLHNLQLFLLPTTENLARANSSSARLYFLSGPRLITHLTSTHSYLAQTAKTLNAGAPQVPERVQQVIDERKRMTGRAEDVEKELACLLARELVKEKTDESDAIVAYKHRIDDTPNALGFLTAIATAFVNELATMPSPPKSYLVVFSSSPSSQTTSSQTVVMLFGSDEKKVKEVGDGLRSKLSVKGGGKGQKWSGKFTGVWLDGREGVHVRELLEFSA
ncbi:Threonyl/alanyl tRNA synthetase [Irpex rosettiformis]|uniref:Threonyl/alanyl tRNA synthetase n=1 Tax=Irpex rosettiformis TaxID=378272 RepID=A0ACB8U4D1_9APHY|nr:Threonyl/alanyl tRNA synthetase [Irpex rosettiformis]